MSPLLCSKHCNRYSPVSKCFLPPRDVLSAACQTVRRRLLARQPCWELCSITVSLVPTLAADGLLPPLADLRWADGCRDELTAVQGVQPGRQGYLALPSWPHSWAECLPARPPQAHTGGQPRADPEERLQGPNATGVQVTRWAPSPAASVGQPRLGHTGPGPGRWYSRPGRGLPAEGAGGSPGFILPFPHRPVTRPCRQLRAWDSRPCQRQPAASAPVLRSLFLS